MTLLDLISPSLVLSAILSTAYAAGFHLVFGGKGRHLLLYLFASWLGFALGQLIGGAIGISVLDIGPVHTVAASLGSWLALITARWLGAAQAKPDKG
jgi:uncharacterized membrane protein YjjP (DUF1212 family)